MAIKWPPFQGVAIPSFHHSQGLQPLNWINSSIPATANPNPKPNPNSDPSDCRPWSRLGMASPANGNRYLLEIHFVQKLVNFGALWLQDPLTK